jgi:hypothetical protein
MALELWPQFTGGSYLRNNAYTDSELCINLYPETSAKGENNRTQMRLLTTPGIRELVDLSTLNANCNGPVYDLITVTQVSGAGAGTPRTFGLVGGIAGSGVFLVEYKGPSTPPVFISLFPVMPNPTGNARPKLVSCGQDQLLYINGNAPATSSTITGGVYNLASGANSALFPSSTPGWAGASDADYTDGYAIIAEPNSQTFYISALQDATSYDPLDISIENDAPDTIVGLRVIHRDVFIFGKSRVLAWNDTGAAGFPFSRNTSATIEVGCMSPATICKLNDTLFWIGRDQRGSIQAWKLNGYNAQRISTPTIEGLWQNYFVTNSGPDILLSGMQCYAYQEEGHQMYVCNFPVTIPSPDGFTWVYDDTEGLWHERKRMNPDGSNVHAGCVWQRCHTFNPLYGHIVGSRFAAKLYYQNRTEGLERGLAILRQRTTPHLYQGTQRNFYRQMVLDISPFPQVINIKMSYTHNAGQTFTTPALPSVTDRGSGKRFAWNRLGSGTDFFCNVFLLGGAEQFAVSGAYLDVQGANPR